jgi:hypothetical protein
VAVAAGGDQVVDIRQPTGFKISGRLAIAPAIEHSEPIMIGLYYTREDVPAAVMMETALKSDLTFEFLNVPSGLTQVRSSLGLPVPDMYLSVRVGGDVTGVELGANTPGVRLLGRVVRQSGQSVPMPRLFVTMRGSPDYRSLVNADGTFEFLRINATALRGALEVRPAGANGLPAMLGQPWGSATAVPGDRDVTGFEIPIAFGVEAKGHIAVETGNNLPDAPPPGAALLTIEASVTNPNGQIVPVAQTVSPVNGTFSFPLAEGSYQITVRNIPEGYRLNSITAGALDLRANPYRVVPGEAARPIQVSLAPSGLRNGTISGLILNADGTPGIAATVGALAADIANGPVGPGGDRCSRGNDPATLWMGSLTSSTQTDSVGRYRLENVPPGQYKLVVGVGLPFPGQGLPRGLCGVTRILSQPLYYPGADLAGGTAFTVGSGVAVSLDFQMKGPASAAPVFNVKGRIVSPAPLNTMGYAMSQELRVTLGPMTPATPATIGRGAAVAPCARQTTLLGVPGADGSFEVRNVPPGPYIACAIIDGGDYARIVSGPINVTIVDRNITDLTFTVR